MKKRKFLMITAVLVLVAFGSFSFNKFKSRQQDLPGKDTVNTNPKIDIKVEKEYDDDGNIIRYDSTYTYVYRHSDGNLEELNMDSIFNNFKPYFFDNGFDIMQSPFDGFFDKDTLYQKHFFDSDYFMQQFNRQKFQFEDMIREMDSLRNRYLKELYPEYQYYRNEQKEKPQMNKKEI